MDKRPSFLDAINETLAAGQVTLPIFSASALKVQREVVKKEADARLVESTIVGDQSLSSQVLQMANSAFYKGLVEVKTVRAAIIRLGLQEVGRIALLASARNQFRSKDRELNLVMKKLWQHSVGCALGARWLANRCRFADLETNAFFAGLFHDIGKLFVLMVVEELKIKGENLPLTHSLLLETMDSLHSEHGEKLMRQWNMPEEYCLVARDHHLPVVDPKDHLLLLVRLANYACLRLGIGLKKDERILLSGREEAQLLNLREIDLAELEIHLEDTPALSG
jgi:HD-like signal output (HDOD) protein